MQAYHTYSAVAASLGLATGMGAEVKRLREVSGQSSSGLASLLGVGAEYLDRLESGAGATVGPAMLYKLSDALGVSCEHWRGHLDAGPAAPDDTALSEREAEVLRLIALGYSNKQIAARLGLSVKTVETYKTRSLKKLGLHGRVGVVRYAAERGWLAVA